MLHIFYKWAVIVSEPSQLSWFKAHKHFPKSMGFTAGSKQIEITQGQVRSRKVGKKKKKEDGEENGL